MSEFYTILTNAGLAAIANATVNQKQVNFAKIAVGDGNGAYYTPTQEATALRKQVWIGNVSSVTTDPDNANWVVVETVIPGNVGGFEIRELGIFDENNVLLAIGKIPLTYKPKFEEGSSKDLYIKAIFEVTNASAVTLKVDPSVIYASKKYVDDKVATVVSGLENVQQQLNQHAAAVDTKLDKHIKEDLGHVRYIGNTGAPNAWVCTSDEIMWENSLGTPIAKACSAYRVTTTHNNTGNVTLALKNSDGSKVSNSFPVLNSDGSQILPGSFPRSTILTLAFYGNAFFLQGSGSGVIERGSKEFTTPGTYAFTVPKGVSKITAYMFGAGGGGGGCFYTNHLGGGGGGGGAFLMACVDVKPGEVINVFVGAGGKGADPGANYGSPGGVSGFYAPTNNVNCFAGGGGGGGYGGPAASNPTGNATPGRGGGGGPYGATGTNGAVDTTEGIEGQLHAFGGSYPGILLYAFTGGSGGWSNYGYYGGGGGGGASDLSGGRAAKGYSLGAAGGTFSRFLGSPGAGPTEKSAGNDATGFGGGGSGSCLPSGRGGNGAPGRVYLYW
ncbi:phage tail protein [Lysinibacillus sphaericus]|uniref:phage tail protein n=1 Tax=Lysinibacillus sphaericus TaxID=1421 RepID=UPI0018CD6837|nr:phage tail protein [Lysinibacillus sphaericus]